MSIKPAAGHPAGYTGSRAVALKLALASADGPADIFYKVQPTASETLPAAVTTREAIGDLPTINARELLSAGLLRRGARRFDVAIPYGNQKPPNDFVRNMREWKGFTGGPAIYDHVIRCLPRDYQLFAGLRAFSARSDSGGIPSSARF